MRIRIRKLWFWLIPNNVSSRIDNYNVFRRIYEDHQDPKAFISFQFKQQINLNKTVEIQFFSSCPPYVFIHYLHERKLHICFGTHNQFKYLRPQHIQVHLLRLSWCSVLFIAHIVQIFNWGTWPKLFSPSLLCVCIERGAWPKVGPQPSGVRTSC
jgi:hypothetical protein